MKANVLSVIKQNNMLKAGDRVVVGLSGGADSVALLCVLNELAAELEIDISACHINHNLRGAESDRDENFCKLLCEKMSVPFTSVSVDVKKYCDINKISTEEAARKLRYDALLQMCKGDKLATAHTLSDNAETVIINLVRGSALDGLCGIPPVRDNIIRPLIGCSRADVEKYLGQMGQDFVTDSSNLTDDYRRNKIRHHVIPQFKDFNESLEETIGRMCRALREDKEFLNEMAEQVLKKAEVDVCRPYDKRFDRLSELFPKIKSYNTDIIAQQQRPIRMRCLKMMLEQAEVGCDNRRLNSVEKLMIQREGHLNLGENAYLDFKDGFAETVISSPAVPITDEELSVGTGKLPIKKKLSEHRYINICELSEKEIKLFVNNKSLQFKNAIDCDKIDDVIMLRNRLPGDRYRPLGRSCTQTFKNLFNSAALPASVRDSLAVLCDNQGVVWLEGFGVSHRASITSNTHRAILVNITEE